NVRRDARDIALQRSEANAARAAVFVEEVNAAAVLEPGRGVNVSIELLGELPDATAVSIHDVEEIGLVALLLVVEANVGDVLAVGRDRRLRVGSRPLGQRLDLPVGKRQLVNLAIDRLLLGLGFAVGGG